MRTETLHGPLAIGALALCTFSVTALLAFDPFHAPPPPPPPEHFAGLPVSGGVGVAERAGFRDCVDMDALNRRCRRHAVRFLGSGPYEAAVDLRGRGGASGFDQLVLWSDDDDDDVYKVIIGLTRHGWNYCYTGAEDWGDQAVFTRAGEPVRISMDISYWGRRRLRVLPAWNRAGLDRRCTPDRDLLRFGRDVAQAAGQP